MADTVSSGERFNSKLAEFFWLVPVPFGVKRFVEGLESNEIGALSVPLFCGFMSLSLPEGFVATGTG